MLMAKGPKGEKRPADAVANTIHFMRIAKGEVEWKLPTPEAKGLGSASAALGRREPDDALDLTAGGASAAAESRDGRNIRHRLLGFPRDEADWRGRE